MPFPLIGLAVGVGGAIAKRLGGGIVKKAAAKVAGAVTSRIGRRVVSTAATVGAGVAIERAGATRMGGGAPPPPALPMIAAGVGGPRQPRGAIRRGIERILPGGRTGRELMPAVEHTDKLGRPLAVYPELIERNYVPPGYVVVTMPDGERLGVLKGVARSMGLWRGKRKPPISAGDWHRLQVAHRVKAKARRVARIAGWTCGARGRSK